MNAEVAKKLINEKFSGKVDKGGSLYIGHLYRVANSVLNDWKTNEVIQNSSLQKFYEDAYIVALLHDIIEDTDVTPTNLIEYGFNQDIVDAVCAITRNSEESYLDFILRVKTNKIASLVKRYDLEDNMDIRRLERFNKIDQKRLKKYFYSWRFITDKITYEEYAYELFDLNI